MMMTQQNCGLTPIKPGQSREKKGAARHLLEAVSRTSERELRLDFSWQRGAYGPPAKHLYGLNRVGQSSKGTATGFPVF